MINNFKKFMSNVFVVLVTCFLMGQNFVFCFIWLTPNIFLIQ